MAKTISTHNGSAANREHNVRNPKATDKQEHIDKDLRSQNEILHDEKPREAYRRIFGAALAEYNAKQKRADRRIQDYYTHVSKDAKRHPVYEMIVQIGDRRDTGLDAPVERECLREFYQGWKERNPNLECIGAYIHADETDGTLHMHVDYVPVARGYQRGLETQSALVAALAQQGIRMDKEHPRTAQIQWEARENAALEAICNAHGIEVIHPQRTGEQLQHLDTSLYKAQQKLEEAQQDLADAQERVEIELDVAQTAQEMSGETLREVQALEERRDALQGDLSTLEVRIQENTGQLHTLTRQIDERREDLQALERALREKISEAFDQGFTGSDIKERIAAVRDADRREQRQSLIEAFLQLSSIQPAWEAFLRDQTRGRGIKPKGKDGPEL